MIFRQTLLFYSVCKNTHAIARDSEMGHQVAWRAEKDVILSTGSTSVVDSEGDHTLY